MNETSNSKFVTRKWNTVNYQSNANYDEGNEIIYNTEVLKSNDAYILVRGDIITAAHNNPTPVAFKNCASFIKCITKYCALSVASVDNVNANFHNIIFTIKNTKLYALIVTLSVRDNQKLSKRLSKRFERSVYWNENKQKGRIKIRQMNIDTLSNKILLELIDYLF